MQVTSMHGDFLLFREKVLSDMSNLESKVKSLSLTIESQDREIALLKEENKKLDKLYQKQDLIQDTECLQNSECLPKMTNREEPSSSVTSVNGASTNKAWSPNRLENGSSSIVAEFQDAVDNVHEEMAVNHAKIATNNDVISSPLITTIVDGEMNDGSVVDLELPGAISYVLPVVPAKALQQGQQLKPCASYAAAVQSNQQRCQEKTKQQQMEQTTGSNRDTTKPSGNTVEFVGVERNRMKTKAFFLSGINDKVTPKQIHDYLCHRNIIPTLLNVFPSKRKGTISAKLNIKIKDLAGLSEPNFWPQFVRCWETLHVCLMANSASTSSLASSIKLTSWDISGVKHNTCFLNESLSNCDILCLQEHWLYPDTLSFLDTIHLDFYSWGRCAKDLDIDATSRRGFGGIAFYWRKHLNVSIDVLSDLGNDRIAVLKVKLMNGNYIYIVNVYLPTASQNAATYNDSKNVVYEPLKTLFMNFMELVQFLLLVTSMPILDPLGNKKH
jgi:hypothetical protein